MSYREFNVDDTVLYTVDDFDEIGKYSEYTGTVEAVYDDHIIVSVAEVSDHLWIDESNDYMIRKGRV